MYFLRRGRSHEKRCGTATVEFAVIAPVFLILILGMLEASRLFDTYGQFAQVARDGGRLGAMDRSDWVANGISSNSKIISDMRNSLIAAGYDPDKLEISIEPAGKPGESFDLDDPNNDLDLFQVRISVPFSEVAAMPVPKDLDYALSTTVTFRNTKSTIIQ
ncbi:pilus assembly protein [Bremerella cremea]|uniref:Pilus assembly protein n=1 Tax=Bremerella cremea TaxID=1031537 RepID=A0A368KJI1_9BACT|nr:TadE family protein [Bremerella cremea]RCS40649.1 pilus assembly protein [Bremerella cremea]